MFTYSSADGIVITVHEWTLDGPARGIVQIAHGMGEHSRRYADVATSLNDAGFHVYAADHRGHGESMHAGPGTIGDDGWNRLVADMGALVELLRGRHPGLPLVLLGHSMGSFAAQQFVLDHSDRIDALILSGTTAVDIFMTHLVAAGPNVFEQFNSAFAPVRTEADWLSRDERQVDRYVADPWCGFGLDGPGMGDLVAATPRLADVSTVRRDLPVYVVVGSEDPLNEGLTLSDLAVQRYRDAGLTDVTYQVYQGARHEVFNETNNGEVVADMITWLDQATGAGARS